MNPLIKKILIGVAVVAVLFVLYRAFVSDEEEAPLSSETPSGLPAEQGGDLLSLLLELKSITLSDGVFSDAAFQTLQDFTVQLAPEPIGRRNPFAPIGAVEVANATTTEPL
ncbi:MAG: hypothetical protein KBD16_01085 [Candidatus Pacebacteria bacterium]|nr:hypothetical protein [Candidatus Paceibacterota bacterium]